MVDVLHTLKVLYMRYNFTGKCHLRSNFAHIKQFIIRNITQYIIYAVIIQTIRGSHKEMGKL